MQSEWIGSYENTEIKVVNTWFDGEKLFVNNELQDEKFGLFGSDLTGHVINKNGERKNIKAHLGGSMSITCRVFVDDKILQLKRLKR
ncbi:MAG: hypothetical protein JKY08_12290 [Flavobacteriaceae bacterium]|nr:hypothetical protein [Flavobacteriaceae bacterium]